jgi:hypothetical protein
MVPAPVATPLTGAPSSPDFSQRVNRVALLELAPFMLRARSCCAAFPRPPDELFIWAITASPSS